MILQGALSHITSTYSKNKLITLLPQSVAITLRK